MEEGGQADRQLSDSDSQEDGGPASVSRAGQPVEPAVMAPAAPAVIPMEALLAITQALKLFNTRNRPEIGPPSFSGERDLKLFIKQFEDVAEANGWTPKQRALHIRSQMEGDAQGCGHGNSYEEILENLHARFGVSTRQARDKLAALKMKPGQSIYSQATEVTRLVEVAFSTLADADRRAMALEHFIRAWESKNIQRHLLAVAPPTIKAAVQAIEYLAVSGTEHAPRAMPVEQTELPHQPSTLEISLKAMAEAVKQQTLLLQ